MTELLFLGTSAMVPTKERNHSGLLIKTGSEEILVDCGEGTQRQMKMFDESLTKIRKILITHWHGDHVLGLPGLLQTASSLDYGTTEKRVEIYGPKGITKQIEKMIEAFPFDKKIEIIITEIGAGTRIEGENFIITPYELDHAIPCLGFVFEEKEKRRIDREKIKALGIPEGPLLGKLQQNETIVWKGKKITPKQTTYIIEGKKIGIIADTAQCKNCLNIAESADILICEATFMEKEIEKAEAYKHLTIKQAALIAHTSNVKKLILTHFSQRYKDKSDLEEEAKNIFPKVVMAYDGLKVEV